MKRGRKKGWKGCYFISREKQWELIQIYLHMGSRVSSEECKALGLNHRYAESVSNRMGFKRNAYASGNSIGRMSVRRKEKLWERARKVGKICV